MLVYWLNGSLTIEPETGAERKALMRLIRATTLIKHGFPPNKSVDETIAGEKEKVLFARELDTSTSWFPESDTNLPAKQVTDVTV
jgi:hypothetical protein